MSVELIQGLLLAFGAPLTADHDGVVRRVVQRGLDPGGSEALPLRGDDEAGLDGDTETVMPLLRVAVSPPRSRSRHQ